MIRKNPLYVTPCDKQYPEDRKLPYVGKVIFDSEERRLKALSEMLQEKLSIAGITDSKNENSGSGSDLDSKAE